VVILEGFQNTRTAITGRAQWGISMNSGLIRRISHGCAICIYIFLVLNVSDFTTPKHLTLHFLLDFPFRASL
jgi:hypothetical protein